MYLFPPPLLSFHLHTSLIQPQRIIRRLLSTPQWLRHSLLLRLRRLRRPALTVPEPDTRLVPERLPALHHAADQRFNDTADGASDGFETLARVFPDGGESGGDLVAGGVAEGFGFGSPGAWGGRLVGG